MKTKKLLSALFSVLIVLMMLPTAAFAEGDAPTRLVVGDTTITGSGYWTTDSSTGKLTETQDAQNWNVHYDGNGTLTLNGATINGNSSVQFGAGIYSEGGTLTIKFEGENSVTGANDSSSAAIYAADSGNLVFSGSGTLTAEGGEATFSYGVYADGGVTVSGGKLDATGDEATFSYGVYADGGVEVSGGTLTATGGEANRSFGAFAADDVMVSGGKVNATGGTATSNSFGVYSFSGNVTVSGGTLEAISGAATYESIGVYALEGGVTVSDNGTLTAEGKTAASSYGVRAFSISVEETGALTAIGGAATMYSSYGVSAGSSGSSVTVSGGMLSATSGESVNGSSYGIFVGSGGTVTVSDGIVFAEGKNSTNFNSYGIFILQGTVTVSGGIVNVTSGVAKGTSCGVYAGNDNITVSNTGELLSNKVNPFPIGTGNWLIYGQTGSVQGNVVLTQDITIPDGVEITIPDGATLTIQDGAALTNKGTIIVKVGGTLTGNVTGNPAESVPQIITGSLNSATVGTAYSQKLEATGNNIIWSVSNGTLPDGLALNESTGEIFGTPNAEDTSTFTVKAENSAGSDTEQFTLTVNKATVAVTGVTLNKTTLSLVEGASAQLTATVEPNNASDKSVTWSSDNPDVATVDQTGKVTAVKEGSANITVKTTDGNYTASCAVTVNKPAPAEFVITFDPNGGYVSYTSAVTSGHKLAALPFASKYGYTFTGWYTANGYPVSTDMIFTGNTTLYAGWVYNGIDIPEQPVKPVQPQEPEYEWIQEDGGTRLYYDGEMITGWYQDEDTGVWYWLDQSSGFMAADKWVKIDGNWYLFDKDGSMLTGWQKVDGKWYYLKPWGGMATGWQYIDNVWYYLRSDGSMAGNAWVMTSGKWYYLTGSGEMATNKWVEWKGDWYFLYSSGVMATNTTIDGYTINSAGVWVQ